MRFSFILLLFGFCGALSPIRAGVAEGKTRSVPKPSPTRADPKPSALVGRWSGYYVMPGPTGPIKVSFTLNLRVRGNELEGETTENNTFSNDPDRVPVLRATIRGKIEGPRITFLKTYDLDLHQVEYEGAVSPDGQKMAGGWKLLGMGGPFEAELVAPTKGP